MFVFWKFESDTASKGMDSSGWHLQYANEWFILYFFKIYINFIFINNKYNQCDYAELDRNNYGFKLIGFKSD